MTTAPAGGAPAPTTDPANPPTGTPAATPPAGDTARTFTQADVDRIVNDRLARAKATPPADYEELRAKAAKLAELEAAQLTEQQRAEQERDQAKAAAEAAIRRANDTLIRASVIAAAASAGAVDHDAVAALIDRNGIAVTDDGAVTGVTEAVAALLEAKPYLVGKAGTTTPTPTPGAANGGVMPGTGGTLTEAQLAGMTPDQIAEAFTKGELNHLLKT